MPSINKECKMERRILLSVLRITSVLLQLNIHTFTNCIVLLLTNCIALLLTNCIVYYL